MGRADCGELSSSGVHAGALAEMVGEKDVGAAPGVVRRGPK